MGLFKNHKRKTLEVEVQGEKFILSEPSAQDLCNYYDIMQKEHGAVTDDSTAFFKTSVNNKVSFRLISYCMYRELEETANNVYMMLCDEITAFDDIDILLKAAEEVSGLKIEAKELQDENSDID